MAAETNAGHDSAPDQWNPGFRLTLCGLSLLFLSVLACATPRSEQIWHKDLSRAETAFHGGEYQTARAELLRLRPESPSLALERYIDFRLALIAAALGDPSRAIDQLSQVEKDGDDSLDEWSSQARLHIAFIYEHLLENPAQAARAYSETIGRYPKSAAAIRALRHVLEQYRDDPAGAVVWLSASYPATEGTDIGDNVLREMARRFQEELDDPEMAWFIWTVLLEDYPYSPFEDDAIFNLGRIAEDTGRHDQALYYWDRLAERNDTSWRLGDYNSKLRDNAMLQRVELLVDLERWEEAAAEYQRLLDAYPRYSDGARVSWERAAILRDELGDREGYDQALRTLVEDYPESVRAEWARFHLKLLRSGTPLADLAGQRPERDRPWLEDNAP